MDNRVFNKLYRSLNPRQREAVDAIEGPVMVLAGPGTGKTTVLTLRIANILRKTDTSPDNILALTFTESGVFSMRKNLVNIIGSAGYKVNISTFHGFCNGVIERYPDEFPRIIGSNPIDDIEKISLLKEIIISGPLKLLRPFGDNFYYLTPLRQKISELKRENVPPRKLRTIIASQEKELYSIPDLYYEQGLHKGEMKGKYRAFEKKILKNKELLKIYMLYEKELEKRRLYDFEDMIVETILTLQKKKDLLLELQEEYHYILADEHQDANNSQNQLLELLASFHDNPNLFIVGDEKQAIFRFQGASLDKFSYFKKLYPGALSVTLDINYRSTQAILDSAHSMISKHTSSEQHAKKLHAENGRGERIELRAFSKPELEYAFLARDIKEKIKEGVEPREIAILYRNNKDADLIVRALQRTDTPFVVESEERILALPEMRKFVAILRAIQSFGSDVSMLPVLHINFLDVDPLELYKFLKFCEQENIGLFEGMESKKTLIRSKVKHPGKFLGLYSLFLNWKKLSQNRGLLEFMDSVVKESWILKHILQSNEPEDAVGALHSFYTFTETLMKNHRDFDLKRLIEYVDMLEEHDIAIQKSSREMTSKSVHFMTAHKSKGLEFDYVYIVGAYDGHWGARRIPGHFPTVPSGDFFGSLNTDDDERRLFYVALTRARLGVFLSYAKEGDGGRQRLPSKFIGEIDERLITEVSTESFESGFKKETFFFPRPRRKFRIKIKRTLNNPFREQGLSVTALNNYLRCPCNYFYSNLLRVPKAPNKSSMFGNAVHRALRLFFNKLKDGELLGGDK